KSQQIRIEATSGLNDDEIKRMKAEAEANAEEDRRLKEEVDKMNNADALAFQTEKQLKEYGDKIPAEKKQRIESALARLKEAHKNHNIAEIDASMAELNSAWQAASEELYKATQEQQTQGQPHTDPGTSEPKSGDDEVTDVDFEEVK
ncbi:MAG TPA: Hsp70 family protein, partial [Bacteroidales bacterium]|nr:Hsp70 family protein [Bacteroidales bacterium]